MQKVVTLTINPAIDKSAEADSVAPEIKIRCDTPQYDPGGGGINVSRAIAKLGGESIAAYTKGGPSGAMLETLLDQENISTKQRSRLRNGRARALRCLNGTPACNIASVCRAQSLMNMNGNNLSKQLLTCNQIFWFRVGALPQRVPD